MSGVERMTERQRIAWPKAVAEIRSHGADAPERLWEWVVQWEDETRPGRGHGMNAVWADGEHFAQVLMDVYGYPSVSVSSTYLIHNSSDDECPCEPCRAYAEDES